MRPFSGGPAVIVRKVAVIPCGTFRDPVYEAKGRCEPMSDDRQIRNPNVRRVVAGAAASTGRCVR